VGLGWVREVEEKGGVGECVVGDSEDGVKSERR
jgi:hypothetical protein